MFGLNLTTWSQVWARRLARHHLLVPAPASAIADVVGDVCGIHAQVLTAAELSLGLRVKGATRETVQAELWERRSLVKTHGPRTTIHLLPAAQAPMWLAAVRAAGDRRRDQDWLRAMGLDEPKRDAIYQAFVDVLDRRHLTLDQLGGEVERRLGSWVAEHASAAFGGSWPRWRVCLGGAAVAGLICFGPNEGRKVTFVRPGQWLAEWPPPPPEEEALREVFKRFVRAYGPSKPAEFARWFTIPPGRAVALAKELRSEFEEVDVEGERRVVLAGDSEPEIEAGPSVHLLPHFDCYLVGCHPRTELFPEAWRERGIPIGGGGNIPVVLVDGRAAGIWEMRRQGGRATVVVDCFEQMDKQRKGMLDEAIDRICRIAQVDGTRTFGTVTPRPHA
jgi:winged helix DNA-binding protein